VQTNQPGKRLIMADQRQSPKSQDGMSGKPQSGIGGATHTSGSKGQERLHGVTDMGSVGRDVPDESKERHTEIAVEAGHKNHEHREIAMQGQPDRDKIADEAVGQRHESAPPYARNAGEEPYRQFAASPGVASSIPEKTAASLGERVGDAYSDPERGPRYAPRPNAGQQIAAQGEANKGVGTSRFLSASGKAANDQERFLTLVASFALGYLAAVLFHDRINAQFNTTSGLQISKPPVDKHPRGFVQATVLKTISEHPQGMTSAEVTTALAPEGIDQQSIANALSALVQVKKINSEVGGGKYRAATGEVPTAPDLPS